MDVSVRFAAGDHGLPASRRGPEGFIAGILIGSIRGARYPRGTTIAVVVALMLVLPGIATALRSTWQGTVVPTCPVDESYARQSDEWPAAWTGN